ncbi:MAG: hypothetical protein AAB403_17120 [Planctomycetota bacterium]
MQTKFIRKDFDPGRGHPGDQVIDYEGGIQSLGLFRKQANRHTLGPHFLRTEYDEESPSHLILHFEAKPEVNLLHLTPIVDRLAWACWVQACKEESAYFARHSAIRTWIRARENYSLLDGHRLSDSPGDRAPALSVIPEANVRRALSSWARSVVWNLDHTGYILSVFPIMQAGIEGPVEIMVSFKAPDRDDELTLLTTSFQKALTKELERLSRAAHIPSEPTQWP